MRAAPLVLRDVRRTYRTEAGELPVLRGVNLTLQAGEIVALVAPSGAGKSTLLHLAGLLERPDGGSIFVEGRDAGTLPDTARTAFAATRSASSISSITCWANSPRWRTWCCRR